tara:strand:+ start:708 stop:926 length:219 start_codon:yes stop_codon:yes gene_type:complete
MKRPLMHDKGIFACGKIAFYALVELHRNTLMDPNNFLLLDGTHPSSDEPIRCGSCGANVTKTSLSIGKEETG